MSDTPTPDATRARILEAAARVFARKGFRAASLDAVAADAGLTKGAIYWHFRSKNDLFRALLEHKFARHTADVPEDLRAAIATGDAQRAASGMLRAALARLQADPDWPRLYLEFIGQARDPQIREELARLRREGLRLAAEYVRAMQQAGLAPADRDADTAATFWNALFDGLLLGWVVDPDGTDLDTLVERIVAMLWPGLAPTPHRSSTP